MYHLVYVEIIIFFLRFLLNVLLALFFLKLLLFTICSLRIIQLNLMELFFKLFLSVKKMQKV